MKNIYRYVRDLRQDLAGVLAEDEDLVVDDELVPLQLHPTLGVKLLSLKSVYVFYNYIVYRWRLICVSILNTFTSQFNLLMYH